MALLGSSNQYICRHFWRKGASRNNIPYTIDGYGHFEHILCILWVDNYIDRIPPIDAIGVGKVWGMVPFIQAVGPTDLLDNRIQILGTPFGRTMYHCWYRYTVAATAMVVHTSNGEYRGRHEHL